MVPKLDDDDLKYDDCNVLVRQYGVFSVLTSLVQPRVTKETKLKCPYQCLSTKPLQKTKSFKSLSKHSGRL